MSTITIPQKLAKKGDLVVIPRKEYEALLELKQVREFTPISAQKKALKQAREDYKKGKYLTFYELKHQLAAQDKK